jgi:hypothetical protein
MRIRMLMFLLFLLLAIVTFAHNGMEHVMGTVKSISANSVTVETAVKDPKIIAIVLLPSTKFVKSGTDASAKDLKVGDRVMIESKENNDNLEAVSIMFGKQPHMIEKDSKNAQH